MKEIEVKDIIKATAGEYVCGNQDTIVTGVSTDSRKVNRGMVFFALKGDRFDGHDFLAQAIESGCSALVVSAVSGSVAALAERRGIALIRVEDTQRALQELAASYIDQFSIYKIGVTGSTGKTTTKEMLYWILSQKYKTIRNRGNYNNLIGLPLSVFEIDEETEAAVFEMGMDRFGEIHRLAEIVKPQIAIITNVGLSHIQHLKSRENIRSAKMEIADFFKEDNVLVVNGDNDMLQEPYEGEYRILTAGRAESAEVRIVHSTDLGESGIRFTLSRGSEKQDFNLGIPGLHNVSNAALAVAASGCLGISMEEAARGLAKLVDTGKRLHITEIKGIKIIDDTYNASPDSMRAAVNVLMGIHGERKIAILGDMFELGEEEEEHHFQIGEYASHAGVDVVISVGKNAEFLSKGAREGGAKAVHFESKDLLEGVLAQWIRPGDVILVKGSRGMAMEEIVAGLKKVWEKPSEKAGE